MYACVAVGPYRGSRLGSWSGCRLRWASVEDSLAAFGGNLWGLDLRRIDPSPLESANVVSSLLQFLKSWFSWVAISVWRGSTKRCSELKFQSGRANYTLLNQTWLRAFNHFVQIWLGQLRLHNLWSNQWCILVSTMNRAVGVSSGQWYTQWCHA